MGGVKAVACSLWRRASKKNIFGCRALTYALGEGAVLSLTPLLKNRTLGVRKSKGGGGRFVLLS